MRMSTLCLADVMTQDQISQRPPRLSPPVFTYYKQSKTGGGNGLEMRLYTVGQRWMATENVARG